MCSGYLPAYQIAHGSQISSYTPHAYNFTYRFRNQERIIRDTNDFLEMLREIASYLRDLRMRIELERDEVQVLTRAPTGVSDHRAELWGEIRKFGDSDYVDVWFRYGRSNVDLWNKTSKERLEISDQVAFSQSITDLQPNTRYYFRAIAVDDRESESYGLVRSFVTDESQTDSQPKVLRFSVIGVTNNSALLRASVDMREYRDGLVFAVYGEDKELITRIPDDYNNYGGIAEAVNDIQKILLDSDLDHVATYRRSITGLDEKTRYYASLCIAYVDDRTDTITCDDVQDFSTR